MTFEVKSDGHDIKKEKILCKIAPVVNNVTTDKSGLHERLLSLIASLAQTTIQMKTRCRSCPIFS